MQTLLKGPWEVTAANNRGTILRQWWTALVISISVYICLAPSLPWLPQSGTLQGPLGHLPGLAVASAPTNLGQTLASWPISNGESTKGDPLTPGSQGEWVVPGHLREGKGPGMCLGTFREWLWSGRGSLPIYKEPRKHLTWICSLFPLPTLTNMSVTPLA